MAAPLPWTHGITPHRAPLTLLACAVALALAVPARAAMDVNRDPCRDCLGFSPRTGYKVRLFGGVTESGVAFPRLDIGDQRYGVALDMSKGIIDAFVVDFAIRREEWSRVETRRPGSEASLIVAIRHTLATDVAAGRTFVLPWLMLGVGTARFMPPGEGALSDKAHSESIARFGVGCDVWVRPRLALFAAWEHDHRTPRLFHRHDYHTEHDLRVGLVAFVADGGRSR